MPHYHSKCGTLRNPQCSMTMSAGYRSKFVALHWRWWHLHMSEKFSSEMKGPLQTNKTKTLCCVWLKIFQSFQYSFNLLLYSPLTKKGKVLHFREPKSPQPKDVLCQIWLKLSLGSGKEVVNVYSLNTIISYLWRAWLLLSSPRNALCQVFWYLTRWFWRRYYVQMIWMDTWTVR